MDNFRELIADHENLGPTSKEEPVKAAETSMGRIVNVMGNLGCINLEGNSIVSRFDSWGQRWWETKPEGNFFEEKVLPILLPAIDRAENNALERGSFSIVSIPFAEIGFRCATRMFLENSATMEAILKNEAYNDEQTTRFFSRGGESEYTRKEWAGFKFILPHKKRDLRIGVRWHSISPNDVDLRW